MALFKRRSREEEQLAAIAMSLGEAAAKTVRGDMPADYFASVQQFRATEVKTLHQQLAAILGTQAATQVALGAGDAGAKEWGKYGGKSVQEQARGLTATAIHQMIG